MGDKNLTKLMGLFVPEVATTQSDWLVAGNESEETTSENNLALNVFTAVILSMLCVTTAIGNILVIISISVVRRLRTPPNTIILSLAISDLNVAVLVMPVAIIYEIKKYWSFNSQLLCDAWISVDQISCTASIVHLCMISIDRYLAISRPFSYERFRTYKFMALLITIAWSIAIMIPLPPLIFFGNESIFNTKQCLISQNKLYTVYSTFTAFYLPLSVMCVVYSKLYKSAAEISKSTNRNCRPYSPSATSNHRSTNGSPARFQDPEAKIESQTPNSRPKISLNSSHSKMSIASFSTILHSSNYLRRTVNSNKNSYSNETKAARTLGLIMGAFCVCWIPFFAVSLIRPFLTVDFPPWVYSVLLWLGYSNSCLNPIIYGMFNREFRTPYYLILSCKFKNINRQCNIALNPQLSSMNQNELNLPPCEPKKLSLAPYWPSKLTRGSVSLSNLQERGEKIANGNDELDETKDYVKALLPPKRHQTKKSNSVIHKSSHSFCTSSKL